MSLLHKEDSSRTEANPKNLETFDRKLYKLDGREQQVQAYDQKIPQEIEEPSDVDAFFLVEPSKIEATIALHSKIDYPAHRISSSHIQLMDKRSPKSRRQDENSLEMLLQPQSPFSFLSHVHSAYRLEENIGHESEAKLLKE